MRNKKKIFVLSLISIILLFFLLLIISYFTGFQLKGKKEVEVAFGEKYKDEGVKANILFFSLKSYVKTESTVNEKELGVYEITYHLPLKTLKRKVIVKDKTSPIITLKGDKEIEISYGETYIEDGYEALDDLDGDLTDKVKITSNIDDSKLGSYEIIYEVTDTEGNKGKTKRIIHIIDNTVPTLTLKGSNPFYMEIGNQYQEPGYTALDNYDGDLTEQVKVTSNVNTNKAGTYEIIYEVEDSSKNNIQKKRTVIVQEKQSGITYINGILLVNKTYHLPSNYAPGDNQEAYQALLRLQNDAKKVGHDLPLLSGYRSYSYQKTLYESYVQRDGEAVANTYSAKPGQSEHQTGLAFDVGSLYFSFGDTAAGIWLRDNAHHYGFIIRYPKGKESITGYTYEPWHIRYINVEVATEIYNRQITLEEYLGVA